MNIFILPTQDAEHISGAKVPALDVINNRIEQKKWPIYERTRNRKVMVRGDILLFYVAGDKKHSGHIIGECKIENIKQNLRSGLFLDSEDVLTEPASSIIELTEIKLFDYPVKFKSILKELDCCPKNTLKWGVILFGGSRRITNHDYSYIINIAHNTTE